MATYAIGDIQGCYDALQELLTVIQFDEKKDILWFTGDLVNRGPQSLKTLRFVKNLGEHQRMVLGNHDLHLLAVASGAHPLHEDDTLQSILTAPDCNELLNWLSHQPLLYHDETLNYTMVHAGLAPSWDLPTAKKLAYEVECVLQDPKKAREFYQHMYGNHPNTWDDHLKGYERLRCITNYFTRVRFCHADGSLELKNKGKINEEQTLIPWFQVENRKNANLSILFGHWAALGGETHLPRVYALDTGCVWGNALTAMRLEDNKRFQVACKK